MKYKTLEELVDEGFDIAFELGPCIEDDNGNPAKWFCSLYCGDSNAPWKIGTKQGQGYGQTQEEALKTAQDNIVEVDEKVHQEIIKRFNQ